jgi:hypothetical protein
LYPWHGATPNPLIRLKRDREKAPLMVAFCAGLKMTNFDVENENLNGLKRMWKLL